MRKHERIPMAVMAVMLAALLAGAAAAQDKAVGYAPTVRVDMADLPSDGPKIVGPTFTVGVVGEDPDAADGLPRYWRFFYGPAELADGTPVTSRAAYEANVDDLVAWDDAAWSDWQPYSADPANNRVTFPDQELDRYWLFAAQVIDTMGVVSLGKGYQVEVAHLLTRDVFSPAVTLCEFYMGCTQATSWSFQAAAGQPLNFAWMADASAYGGNIVSYRHGWDLRDINDPNDPGWAVPPGLSEENLRAEERTFQDGQHVFTLRVEDDSRQVTLVQVQFSVVPFVPRMSQAELMVIDQVVDDNSNAWLDEQGFPRDNEAYRNAYWQFLAAGSGGVDNFDWERDRFDHTETPTYADLVGYKAVLCFARAHSEQTMFQQFRPELDYDLEDDPYIRDKYVWLTPYQWRGGNFFLVGDRSMESFLRNDPRYMTPIVFTSPEQFYEGGNTVFTVGFGDRTEPDGTVVARGPLQYPYATAGIALLDWTSPASKYVYARPMTTAAYQRRVDCVGLKGLVLDDAFRSNHGVVAGDIPDTILTDQVIDWHDDSLWQGGTLPIVTNLFPFRNDEFVDANISPRTTDWAPQTCDDPAAPGGMCVEPMFRGMSRFDWLREFWWANGDPDWPTGGDPDFWDWGAVALQDTCGTMALTSYEKDDGFVMPAGSSRANDQVYGYLSYSMTAEKPWGQADVYWGFDPYRFDNEQTKDAVRWVLRYFDLNVRD